VRSADVIVGRPLSASTIFHPAACWNNPDDACQQAAVQRGPAVALLRFRHGRKAARISHWRPRRWLDLRMSHAPDGAVIAAGGHNRGNYHGTPIRAGSPCASGTGQPAIFAAILTSCRRTQ